MLLNHKVKLITVSQHVIGIVGLIYYWPSLAGILTALICWFLYFGLGVSGGFHKMICHRGFETNKFWRYTLLALGTGSGFGSSVAWTVSHRLHHNNSDTDIEHDPYYPQGTFKNKFISWWVTPRAVPYNPLIVKDLLVDPVQRWIHLNYFKVLFAFVLVLTLINPWLTVFAWALPNVLGYHAIQAVGVISHSVGKQPHDNGDNSRDNYVVGILTFGEGFQNTHHKYPNQYRLHRHDVVGYLIEKFIARQ